MLRIQAMSITQNLLADATPSEIARMLGLLGDQDLLEILKEASGPLVEVELRVPVCRNPNLESRS